VKVFRSGLLVYCISTFKLYLYVGMFEKVCDFSDLGTVICEGKPFFFALVVDFVSLGFVLRFHFNFSMRGTGNLLLLVMVRIFCHCFFSGVSGKDNILLIR
jgi:hypothetical protein